MGKARLEFDYAAFGELRNDPEVNAALRRLAQGIADRACLTGTGYKTFPTAPEPAMW